MRNEQMVGTRLPKELVKDLETIEGIEQADRSTTVRKLLAAAIQEWKLEYYARQYGKRKLGMAAASRAAGVTLWEMIEYVREHRIASPYDENDLEHDLRGIMRRRRSAG